MNKAQSGFFPSLDLSNEGQEIAWENPCQEKLHIHKKSKGDTAIIAIHKLHIS